MRKIIYESIGWAVLVYVLVAFNDAKADAYKGKEDIHKDGKPSIVHNVNKHGRLYPFKTYNFYDSLTRPKYWNGYGVDPSGANYWYYFNEETECLEGYREVWEDSEVCRGEEREGETPVEVTSPSVLTLVIVGIVCMVLKR